MNEADKINRSRMQQANRDQRTQQQATEREEAKIKAALIAEIQKLKTTVLTRLKQLGYPDMENCRIEQKKLIGYKTVDVAGWRIGTYSFVFYGDDQTGSIYLLSDGKFQFTGGHSQTASRDLDDMYLAQHLRKVRDGLKELMTRLDSA